MRRKRFLGSLGFMVVLVVVTLLFAPTIAEAAGPAPIITSVSPGGGEPGQELEITIFGENFAEGAKVSFSGAGIIVNSVTFVSENEMRVNITIAVMDWVDMPLLYYDVIVVNPDEQSYTLEGGFIVGLESGPVMSVLSRGSAEQGETFEMTIMGSDFADGALVYFSGTGISVTSLTFVADNEIWIEVFVDEDAALGPRDITMLNPDGQSDSWPGVFTILEGPRAVLAIPDVSFTPPLPEAEDSVIFTATVENVGDADATDAMFWFMVDGTQIGQEIWTVPAGESVYVPYEWVAVEGTHDVWVWALGPDDKVLAESDRTTIDVAESGGIPIWYVILGVIGGLVLLGLGYWVVCRVRMRSLSQVTLDRFVPDTVEAGTETEVTLVGTGFTKGMRFRVDCDGIDIRGTQFQDTGHYQIHFNVAPGVAPGHYMFSVSSICPQIGAPAKLPAKGLNVTNKNCDEAKKKWEAAKKKWEAKKQKCDDLQDKVSELENKKRLAEQEKQRREKKRDDANQALQAAQAAFDQAIADLKKFVDNHVFSDVVGTSDKKGAHRYGLYGDKVWLYFSGDAASFKVISQFLKSCREGLEERQAKCREADEDVVTCQEAKDEAQDAFDKADAALRKVEDELVNAKSAADKCKAELKKLEGAMNALEKEYQECLKRLKEQRECEKKIGEAESKYEAAKKKYWAAKRKLDRVEAEQEGLEQPNAEAANRIADCIKAAGALLEKAKAALKKAKDELEKARQQYKNGCLKNAESHVDEAKSYAQSAGEEAGASNERSAAAGSAIDDQKKAEAKRKAEKAAKEAAEKKEQEWWEKFMEQDDPSPHDIKGGKKNLAIGLADVIGNFIMEEIANGNFPSGTCRDKCLISLRNIFREQWVQILKDIAWGVFWNSIKLPSIVTETGLRISFSIFKGIIGKLIKGNKVIPLWGKHEYAHPADSFKGFPVGRFKCKIESYLVYNKETGYVVGMVRCKCEGSEARVLYIKYKCNEYGRALAEPAPRIEFR